MSEVNPKIVIEAALFASAEPLTPERLQQLFDEQNPISLSEIKNLLSELKEDYRERGVDLQEVASGYRFQARPDFSPWLQRLWEKKPARYSRALLETLALIVYRQPISRGEIEEVRGVAVSSDIIKKLLDREWISVVAHRDVPGKPALFGTTKTFLDYFNLKSLEELPPLEDVVDLEKIEAQFGEQLALVVEKKAAEGTEPSALPLAEED
ncbi:SMC-Scp complex subunit ScpB [Coxiella burnetii]|uniref:Segregation and condensation protein B homolog n=2 Tax=Coxiella burnetii TaxID=777 RepID=SCPBL_COXBU|nr:SMC-Scp complex subunit ScpB [Coxiella burnetii]NP_820060.1 segregation and condensation protein [Coxiella burnetii RSA 493]Q83CP9.1 RecName: Full=Segregation and condensation protein B homolog [Coxiella burnetii RSA 493]AAO90574.1 segregation and condensation protein [Coxiella burnetii RSA 493]ABS77235.1 segregation and condensation protein [Coxiella burnetii Dugway 5J108-111]ARI65875.1 SMC-Scp complex subunit ScpB [Coxiella burnetii]ARK27342.1 SMC-Scp complex subunit ScpB [Coxiella burne